ncbi:deoxyribodipyrimidine photolyase [Enterovibrio norvegicus]|uniref:DASH family cryptochrome n=1 Tax=Enterovibrio norvegicus TaxID=188144 RepID=UPI0002E194F7|nr:DASH family cryptochrome [Enterovibrio norvegicus]OEE50237.1 deoxyribodipyrimidine photolyase [Enterovibrio norvegicus]
MKGLIWFRNDLRLGDNPALVTLTRRCEKAIMLFVIDPEWFRPTHFQSKHMGRFREEFLYQSLRSLECELKKRKQRLVVKVGNPLEIIPDICQRHGIDLVTVTDHPGVNEQQHVAYLKRVLPSEVSVSESFTLYLRNQINFTKDSFPKTFTQFRRHVDHQNLLPCIPISAPESLPSVLDERRDFWGGQEFVYDLTPYHGGEDSGSLQLNQFFWKTQGLKHYKDTRNDLDGWRFSSRLSAWLANGSLSARMVAAELDNYEYRHGSGESTRTIFAELLWRDYYQWMMHVQGARMFAFDGLKQKRPLTRFHSEKFKAWEQGTTEFPIVNACMRQLNQTGWMSHRGRHIAASCLVNELGIDWRFGAAYFEQQLIDFDVSSNYGNWQAVAGVDADPEEHPQFDVNVLASEYDPEGVFVDKWAESSSSESLLKY